MSELSEALLYNLGLAVHNSLSNPILEPDYIMNQEEERIFNDLCDKYRNFSNDLSYAVKSAKNEFDYALSIKQSDYSDENEFF